MGYFEWFILEYGILPTRLTKPLLCMCNMLCKCMYMYNVICQETSDIPLYLLIIPFYIPPLEKVRGIMLYLPQKMRSSVCPSARQRFVPGSFFSIYNLTIIFYLLLLQLVLCRVAALKSLPVHHP